MWKTLLLIHLVVLRYSLCDISDDETACVINSSYDLEYALANAAVCRLLHLRVNITLTSDNFSAQGLTLTDQSVVIQSDPNANFSTKLDFGTYTPVSTIRVTGNSTVTLRHLQLQNYLATQLQNGTTTTIMPLFTFSPTASLYVDDVHLLMDAARCSQDANYSNLLYTPRQSWWGTTLHDATAAPTAAAVATAYFIIGLRIYQQTLCHYRLRSTHPQAFQGSYAPSNGIFSVQHAVVSITVFAVVYTRVRNHL